MNRLKPGPQIQLAAQELAERFSHAETRSARS